MESWLQIPKSSQFSIANIPFGIITTPHSKTPRPAVAIGDFALDLATFASGGGFSKLSAVHNYLSVFQQPTLNDFAALGRPIHRQVRAYLQDIFQRNTPFPEILCNNHALSARCLFAQKDVQSHLPMYVGDYTDCYGGMNHAVNAGSLFRPQAAALTPNFLHLPLAYHGRASSVVISGTPIRRPWGQTVGDLKDPVPELTKCRTMDFELEVGVFLCGSNKIGDSISIAEAEDYLFGYVLLNDWSARDVQRWEYVPLGPFTGKNLGTAVSPWVVLADALEPFCKEGLTNPRGAVLPYLRHTRKDFTFDLNLEVDFISGRSNSKTIICQTNAADGLVWSFPQMLVQHTITGCPMQVGDLLGSGTISGTTEDSLGCLLEKTLNGKRTIKLEGGEERTWLEDGDSIVLRGWAGRSESGLVGFGECKGQIIAAYER